MCFIPITDLLGMTYPLNNIVLLQYTQHCNSCAHVYLADDCIAVSSIAGCRFLRSVAHLELTVPRTRTMTSGPRAFPVCGPTVWNSLPCTLRSSELSYKKTVFGRNLKLNCSLKAASVICAPLRCSGINCAPTCKFTNNNNNV